VVQQATIAAVGALAFFLEHELLIVSVPVDVQQTGYAHLAGSEELANG
jgi:hypothetical protein